MVTATFPMVTSLSNDSWGVWTSSTFLTLDSFPWKVGQFLAICPFFRHHRQSPSFMHQSLSSLVSFDTLTVSTSIMFGSLVGVVEVVVKGR